MLVVVVLWQKFLFTAFCVIFSGSNLSFINPSYCVERDMQANKENVRRKVKTKIPLPLDPLPALPMHLLNKDMENYDNERRRPLKTLTQTNVLPSSSRYKQEKSSTKAKSKVKIDTKHVTMRKRTEDLDWDYNVFKDPDQSVISISDDDVDVKCEEETFFDGNQQRNCLGERLATTPSEKLQHKAVRNVKRSLKRPHSRELQGLSPSCELEKREGDKVKRRLKFNESLQDILQSPDFCKYLFKYLSHFFSILLFIFLIY